MDEVGDDNGHGARLACFAVHIDWLRPQTCIVEKIASLLDAVLHSFGLDAIEHGDLEVSIESFSQLQWPMIVDLACDVENATYAQCLEL